MTEVGIRELKSRLSYYIKLMQTGEVIAINDRDTRVGFLTNESQKEKRTRSPKQRTDLKKLKKILEKLKAAGLIDNTDIPERISFNPVKPRVPFDSTELIRKMRDEEIG